ncbi:kinase-like domain-containing protein [Trichoderma sp. SZMC 28013]
MAPEVTSWEELLWVHEVFNCETPKEFQHTEIAKVDDDKIFYCKIKTRQADITFQEITAGLARIPDDEIFPPWPQALTTTKAPQELPSGIFIKRPQVELYGLLSEHEAMNLALEGLVEEAEAFEVLRSQPHPNIVGYHGCHVRRGYITGLVLDRHPYTLEDFLKSGQTIQDEDLFMDSLRAAISHLHTLGWAHNDLHPANVLVAEDGRPILIDFGSCRRIGEKLSLSRGTMGWIDCKMKDYTTSETHHDTFALDRIHGWLSNPIPMESMAEKAEKAEKAEMAEMDGQEGFSTP